MSRATGIDSDSSVAIAKSEARRLAMSRLMAVAGHDLKQPLQLAVMAISGAFGEGVEPRAANRLKIAIDALKRLDFELADLARSSQFGAGRATPWWRLTLPC